MMNVFKIAFILLFLLLTTFAVVTKPAMHKTVVLGDINYTVSQPQEKVQPVKVVPQAVKPVEQKVQTVQKPQPKVIVQVIEEHIKTQPKTVKTTSTPKTTTVKTSPKVVENVSKPIVKETTPVQEVPKVIPPKKIITTPVKTVNETPLTEAEEIIAWNKWRSDLQNQVMKDSKISAPVGTVFNFTFTVDKNGNVSNIKTWSGNNNYTPTAKRVLKPLLIKYQHTAILKFPARTKRKIVNVEGGFTISTIDRFSTPADYHDYERIK